MRPAVRLDGPPSSAGTTAWHESSRTSLTVTAPSILGRARASPCPPAQILPRASSTSPSAASEPTTRRSLKAVMEERQAFNTKVVHQRMVALPFDDHRRKAWPAISSNDFACCALSHPIAVFSPKQWHVSVALFFGLPVAAAIPHIGCRIKAGGSGNPVVDAHGHNVLSLQHPQGGGTSALHNTLIRAVSNDLENAGLKPKTAGINGGIGSLFRIALSGGNPLDNNGRRTELELELIQTHMTQKPML